LDRLPLIRVAEVAFLTRGVAECAGFYRELGLPFDEEPDRKHIHFADVGEQYFGFADEERGFFTGYGDERARFPLHVAFEVPGDKLDECSAFLRSKGVKVSPRVEASPGWHGAAKSASVYFTDPAGNIMELWAPQR
jgi:catechol 2,3-dioxygenase-like lactoylglutathione lyase family enzyme